MNQFPSSIAVRLHGPVAVISFTNTQHWVRQIVCLEKSRLGGYQDCTKFEMRDLSSFYCEPEVPHC